MRVPRRHRFRVRGGAAALLRALPPGDRFCFAPRAAGPRTFGAGARATLAAAGGEGASGPRFDEDPLGGDPLLRAPLRALLPRVPLAGGARLPASFDFPGGAVGFATYERCTAIEGFTPRALGREGPSIHFAIYDTFATWSPGRGRDAASLARAGAHPDAAGAGSAGRGAHASSTAAHASSASGEVEVVSWGLTEEGSFDEALALRRAGEMEERLREAAAAGAAAETAPAIGTASPALPRASLDPDAHARAVHAILEHIRRGDIYQANLTARFDAAFPGDPLELFERLLASNPSPHSAFLEAAGVVVVSSSPERLIAVSGRDVEARPIKGTAHRDADPARDRAAAAWLLASEKDRAELLMITDLLRNDLGKVCEYGSVRVSELRALESFAHVHHLVSTIRGRLHPGLDALDALHAVSPCGSITGTPKRRALEILAALEPAPRDVYTGAVGWVGFDRSAHWSVAIRTGILSRGVFTYGAGGGIVADSRPELEWEELRVKAKGIEDALGVVRAHEPAAGSA